MHLLSMLLLLLGSTCTAPEGHQRDSLTTHRPDNNIAESRNAGNASAYGSSAANYNFKGSGTAEFVHAGSIRCENCVDSGSGTVNVHEEGFVNLQKCNDRDCNSGLGNNLESEVSSYSGSAFTPVDCKGGECGGGRLRRDLDDDVTDASVYEKNGCGHSYGLVQWKCDYSDTGKVAYCFNISRCDRAAMPGHKVCDSWQHGGCVYIDRTNFTALYYICNYARWDGDEGGCYLMTALLQGDRYTLCHYRLGIKTKPWCSDYPASEYCRYTQPSTKRLGKGCTYSGECGDVECGEEDVTDVSVYEENGCGQSGGMVQWKCKYSDSYNGDVDYCYNISRCDTAAVPGHQECRWRGENCVYVDGANFTALYYRCLQAYDNRWKRNDGVCILITALQQGDRYSVCHYMNHINTKPVCYDHSASGYCKWIQPRTNRLTHSMIPVIVYITGLLLNHLILLVLAWKAEATVTNCLLKLLAVWDSLYLVCQLAEWAVWMQYRDVPSVIKDVGYAWVETGCYLPPKYIQDEFCDMMDRWRDADINVAAGDDNVLPQLPHMRYMVMYWLHTAARLFQLMSVYQTVIIACFRYIAIKFPFQADRYLTFTTAWLATLVCLVLAGLLHVPSVIGGVALHTATRCNYNNQLGVLDKETYEQNNQCISDIGKHNPLYSTSDTSFMMFFHVYHVIFYHIVMFFTLPFIILLILNMLMLRELWQGSQTQENIAVTRVVVAIVSVFLISYMIKPFYIIDVFYFDGALINSIAHCSCSTYFTMSVLIIILPCLNSSVNFIIYIGFRESFRRQFVSMFDCCRIRFPCPCKRQAAVDEKELQRRL